MEVDIFHAVVFGTDFKERIWGSNHLTKYGYHLPEKDVGEIWAISAHQHGDSIITNGIYAGETLSHVWKEHKELFGEFPSAQFPLMVKMIDAQEPLSVQVHPDTNYAYEHENGDYGKKNAGILSKRKRTQRLSMV